jgi:hypothetical protein
MYLNGKMRIFETVPRIGVGKIRKNDRVGEFNYDKL